MTVYYFSFPMIFIVCYERVKDFETYPFLPGKMVYTVALTQVKTTIKWIYLLPHHRNILNNDVKQTNVYTKAECSTNSLTV